MSDEFPESVELPIDGTLDLHAFSPKDLGSLIPDYLDLCQTRGIVSVRIIHGKGVGAVQRSVHALLARHPQVLDFRLADGDAGGWGATLVELRRISTSTPTDREDLCP